MVQSCPCGYKNRKRKRKLLTCPPPSTLLAQHWPCTVIPSHVTVALFSQLMLALLGLIDRMPRHWPFNGQFSKWNISIPLEYFSNCTLLLISLFFARVLSLCRSKAVAVSVALLAWSFKTFQDNKSQRSYFTRLLRLLPFVCTHASPIDFIELLKEFISLIMKFQYHRLTSLVTNSYLLAKQRILKLLRNWGRRVYYN